MSHPCDAQQSGTVLRLIGYRSRSQVTHPRDAQLGLAEFAAHENASRHAGRPVEPAERDKLADTRSRLATGLEQDRARQVTLSKTYRKVMARIDDGVTEQRLRSGQPEPIRRTEANGRAARRAQADDVSTPATWRPLGSDSPMID